MKSLRSLVFSLALLGLAIVGINAQTMTTNNGAPVGDNQNSITAGENGPVLLQDTNLIEKLAQFDRERIPERVVHARGAGAHGVFESYGDFTQHTKAAFLNQKGKKVPVFVRFSTVIHPSGSPEIARDPRGFATKFYTEEGNYDLVGNNLPVFFIRDAIKFPDMVHSLKPSPITNKQDPNRFFDFFSHVPESTQMLTFVFSDMGTPANYRQMDGFGVHAFKWINAKGEAVYVKYKWTSQQGHKNLSADETEKVVAKDWGNATTDLYENIAKGNFPAWELSVQMIKLEDIDKFDFNPLDATKVWSETIAPSVKIGKMTLNKVPENFFEESEQSAFAPANLVPGIEASEDRLLQGRLFSYLDTQRYRLGANFTKIDINRPKNVVTNYSQDGALRNTKQNGDINFQPSRTNKVAENTTNKAYQLKLNGLVQQARIKKENNFVQAGELYLSFDEKMRANLIKNLAGDLNQVKNKMIKAKIVGHFYMANQEYGMRLAQAVGVTREDVEKAMKE
ncbi:MAG: catalase [Acidobacteriota bacterium]